MTAEKTNGEGGTSSSGSSSKIYLTITFNTKSLAFSTKRQKPLAKVFSTFSEHLNMEEGELRFFFNGSRIRPEQTPEELEMEEGEEIQASVMQHGGGSKSLAVRW